VSSKQDLYDLGVTFGLLGAFHAPDHTGDPDDGYALEAARLLHAICGTPLLLTRQHEPRRVLRPDQDPRLVAVDPGWWMRTPASGVVLPRAFLDETGVTTLAMPVTDHTIVSAQVLDEGERILAFAMLRVTRNRSFGPAGEIATLLETLEDCALPAPIAQVRFHLNAGRGPCCLPVDRDYLAGIREAMGDAEFDVGRCLGYDSETGRSGISMVKIVEMDIDRACAGRFQYEVHTRDNECVVCCAKHHGMPYYAPEDGRHNLAFVRTDRVMPKRTWGRM
jgi:hypothetical protein